MNAIEKLNTADELVKDASKNWKVYWPCQQSVKVR